MSFHEVVKNSIFGSISDSNVTSTLVWGGFIFTICQFLITFIQPAPYGRYTNSSPSFLTWCQINSKVAWIVQECPAFFVSAILLFEAWASTNTSTKVLVGMFMLHYFQRSFIYPILMRPGSRSPILPTAFAFLFCFFNGFLQTHVLLYDKMNGTAQHDEIFFSPSFLTGLFIFVFGLYVNVDSDRRLRGLRSKDRKPGEYKIPTGGMFEYVSAANYFGEICEWWGYSLAAQFNPGSLFFAGFSTIFLGMRGLQHHRFYLDKFKEDYPKDRKAVIPFII